MFCISCMSGTRKIRYKLLLLLLQLTLLHILMKGEADGQIGILLQEHTYEFLPFWSGHC